MSEENLYFEKYSIAPAPSRDYYGIKIIDKEIKLFYWPISHGPHKNISVKSCCFSEWKKDKSFQHEIEIIFGKSVCQYTSDIVFDRKTLLTIPNNFLKNLLNYLSSQDIINLLLVSKTTYQIFKKDFVPQLIRKKILQTKIFNIKGNKSMSGWKQVLQEKQDIEMQSEKCKITRINGTKSAPRLQLKNSSKSILKPQLDISKITSAQSLNDKKNFEEINKLKKKTLPNRYSKKEISINKINVEFNNPNDEKITNNLPDNKYKTNNDKNDCKITKIDSKLLNSKKPLTKNIYGLKNNYQSIDNIVKNTTDELKNMSTIFDDEYDWFNDLSLSKSNNDQKQKIKQDNIASKNIDKLINKTTPSPSKWQSIKMRTLANYDDYEKNILKSYQNINDEMKKKIISHRKLS